MRFTGLALLLALSTVTYGAETLTPKQPMNLWPGKAPGALGDAPVDIPTLTAFLPPEGKASGAAIVICPGGGYGGLANHEGPVIGEWLAKNGITAFVLKYRLGSAKYRHPVELGDAQRAIRTVRANAEVWKIDPKRIGILGFSAGGHLASSAATHYTDGDPKSEDLIEKVSSRPDIQVLVYPVITMGPGTHMGSRNNLLGAKPDQALIDLMSNEKQVNEKTPPAFLVHSTKDPAVPVSNSDLYAEALKKFNVPYEYVRGEIGGHGFGLTKDWDEKCLTWLHAQKY